MVVAVAVGALVGVAEGSGVGVAEGTGVAVAVGTGDGVEVALGVGLATACTVGEGPPVALATAVATTIAPSATTVPEIAVVSVRTVVPVITLAVGVSVGVGAVVEVDVGGGRVGVGLTNNGDLAGMACVDSAASLATVWAVAVAGVSRSLSSAPAEGPPLLRKISHNRIRETMLAMATGASGRHGTSFRPHWGQMLR